VVLGVIVFWGVRVYRERFLWRAVILKNTGRILHSVRLRNCSVLPCPQYAVSGD
jgi:hypothetical protein